MRTKQPWATGCIQFFPTCGPVREAREKTIDRPAGICLFCGDALRTPPISALTPRALPKIVTAHSHAQAAVHPANATGDRTGRRWRSVCRGPAACNASKHVIYRPRLFTTGQHDWNIKTSMDDSKRRDGIGLTKSWILHTYLFWTFNTIQLGELDQPATGSSVWFYHHRTAPIISTEHEQIRSVVRTVFLISCRCSRRSRTECHIYLEARESR
jgi:hypothetical protein